MHNYWKEKVQDTLLTTEKQSQFRELKVQAIEECKAFKENMYEQKRIFKDQMKRDLKESLDSFDDDIDLDGIKNDIIESFNNEISQLIESLKEDSINLSDFMLSYKEFSNIDQWPSVFIDVGDIENVDEYSQMFQSSTSKNYDIFGLFETKIPPEQIAIQKIAENDTIIGLYDPYTKYSAPVPDNITTPGEDLFDYVEMIWKNHNNTSSDIPEPGKNIKICIIDTGIDQLNKSFDGKIILSENFTSDFDTKDYNGHGTHCAGLAAGSGIGEKLCAGVAPRAQILAAKVLSKDGHGNDEGILAGLGWAYNQGVDVISLSLGDSAVPEITDGSSLLSKACSKLARLGKIVCVSAGNCGRQGSGTITRPGDAKEVITVGAVNRNQKIAEFSSKGPTSHENITGIKPNLVAPGVNIVSARASLAHFGQGQRPIKNSGSLIEMDGTSMACPIVAGAAAVLLSYIKENHIVIATEEIIDIMYDTAKELPEVSKYEQGHGLIQLHDALQKIKDNYSVDSNTETNEKQLIKEKLLSTRKKLFDSQKNQRENVTSISSSSFSSSKSKQKCAYCNKDILTKLSIGGTCQTDGCEELICSMCWKFKKVNRCKVHS